jgi:hypothetical protein
MVPVGTTGDSPTLSHDEHRQVKRLYGKLAERASLRHRRSPAGLQNGRCRLHGGKSTGPITGLERKATCRHGHYSVEAKQERLQARKGALKEMLKWFQANR